MPVLLAIELVQTDVACTHGEVLNDLKLSGLDAFETRVSSQSCTQRFCTGTESPWPELWRQEALATVHSFAHLLLVPDGVHRKEREAERAQNGNPNVHQGTLVAGLSTSRKKG